MAAKDDVILTTVTKLLYSSINVGYYITKSYLKMHKLTWTFYKIVSGVNKICRMTHYYRKIYSKWKWKVHVPVVKLQCTKSSIDLFNFSTSRSFKKMFTFFKHNFPLYFPLYLSKCVFFVTKVILKLLWIDILDCLGAIKICFSTHNKFNI